MNPFVYVLTYLAIIIVLDHMNQNISDLLMKILLPGRGYVHIYYIYNTNECVYKCVCMHGILRICTHTY